MTSPINKCVKGPHASPLTTETMLAYHPILRPTNVTSSTLRVRDTHFLPATSQHPYIRWPNVLYNIKPNVTGFDAWFVDTMILCVSHYYCFNSTDFYKVKNDLVYIIKYRFCNCNSITQNIRHWPLLSQCKGFLTPQTLLLYIQKLKMYKKNV